MVLNEIIRNLGMHDIVLNLWYDHQESSGLGPGVLATGVRRPWGQELAAAGFSFEGEMGVAPEDGSE
jgi:hypothetical protein